MKNFISIALATLPLIAADAGAFPYPHLRKIAVPKNAQVENVVYQGLENSVNADTWRSTVQLNIGQSTQCTGSFIQKNVLITAAHCVLDKDTSSLDLRFYLDGLPAESRTYSESHYSVFINPTYLSSTPHDLAVIIFKEPLFSSGSPYQILTPLQLVRRTPIATGETIYIAGTGRTKLNSTLANENLNFAEGTVARRTYQGRALSIKMKNASGVCGGDSGSPLTINENGNLHLIGVASASSVDLGDCGSILYASLITPEDLMWIQSLLSPGVLGQ